MLQTLAKAQSALSKSYCYLRELLMKYFKWQFSSLIERCNRTIGCLNSEIILYHQHFVLVAFIWLCDGLMNPSVCGH